MGQEIETMVGKNEEYIAVRKFRKVLRDIYNGKIVDECECNEAVCLLNGLIAGMPGEMQKNYEQLINDFHQQKALVSSWREITGLTENEFRKKRIKKELFSYY